MKHFSWECIYGLNFQFEYLSLLRNYCNIYTSTLRHKNSDYEEIQSILGYIGTLKSLFEKEIEMTHFIRFSNRFTTTFKCKHPIVLAPMGGISGSQLASAVSAAGGIGFLGTGGQNPHSKLHFVGVGEIVKNLREAQKASHASTVGVGLTIEGFLDKDAPVLDQVLSTNPHNLWLSTDGAGVVNFGPFCKLATSSRIPVNLFVQVIGRVP